MLYVFFNQAAIYQKSIKIRIIIKISVIIVLFFFVSSCNKIVWL